MFVVDEEENDIEVMKIEKGEESDEENEKLTGRCFVTIAPKSPMTARVDDLLISLNVPLNCYHAVLSEFDETCSYLNDMLISMGSDVEKSKTLLYEARNKLDDKNSKIEGLKLKIKNIICDRDSLRRDKFMLVKQRNMNCNTTKHIYGKLTDLYHPSEFFKG